MMYDVMFLHLNFDIMLISYTGTQIEKPAGRSTKSKPKCLKFSLLLINLISPTSLLDCNKLLHSCLITYSQKLGWGGSTHWRLVTF